MAGKGSTTPRVAAYLTDNPDVILHRAKMAKVLSLKEQQVYASMRTLMNNAEFGPLIESVIPAQAWRYNASQADDIHQAMELEGDVHMFTKIGTLDDGSVLYRNEDGKVGTFVEL